MGDSIVIFSTTENSRAPAGSVLCGRVDGSDGVSASAIALLRGSALFERQRGWFEATGMLALFGQSDSDLPEWGHFGGTANPHFDLNRCDLGLWREAAGPAALDWLEASRDWVNGGADRDGSPPPPELLAFMGARPLAERLSLDTGMRHTEPESFATGRGIGAFLAQSADAAADLAVDFRQRRANPRAARRALWGAEAAEAVVELAAKDRFGIDHFHNAFQWAEGRWMGLFGRSPIELQFDKKVDGPKESLWLPVSMALALAPDFYSNTDWAARSAKLFGSERPAGLTLADEEDLGELALKAGAANLFGGDASAAAWTERVLLDRGVEPASAHSGRRPAL